MLEIILIVLKSSKTINQSISQDGQNCFCGLQCRRMESWFPVENLYNFIESDIRISPASVSSENEGLREQAYRPITFMHQSFVSLAGFEP